MVRPIEPTPVLHGEDAKAVLRSLRNVCSPEEIRHRREAARRTAETMTRPEPLKPEA